MEVEQLFRLASDHFEQNNYQEGLDIMTKCIEHSPSNSALYSNRALFHSQLGNIDAAVNDLLSAINYNYLNYVAYFNLFSLQFNAGQILPAFNNLCCSLSCLYLVRARKAKRQLDVQRSIKYAENNPQAHILKALMYLKDGKNKLALNEIEWALDIEVHVPLCLKIKNIINRKLNPYAVSEIFEQNPEKPNFRLHTSYQPAEDFDGQIRERVHQFNEIYDELVNSQYGTITQKVPRLKLGTDNSHFNYENSNLLSENSGIYEIRYRDLNLNKQSKEKTSETPTKEHPNEENDSDLLIVQPSEAEDKRVTDEDDNLLDDDDSLDKMQNEFINEDIKNKYHQQERAFISQKQLISLQNLREVPINVQKEQQNLLSEVKQSPKVPLYPIGSRKKIQFIICSAEVKNAAKLKDLYITGNYNSRKGLRLKTPNKKIDANMVRWETSIAPTPISEIKQTVNVKLFNKQYFSYDDDLVGEGEVEVICSGETRIPIYFKNKLTGFVNLRVDLI